MVCCSAFYLFNVGDYMLTAGAIVAFVLHVSDLKLAVSLLSGRSLIISFYILVGFLIRPKQ